MRELQYVAKSPVVDAMWFNHDTFEAVRRWAGSEALHLPGVEYDRWIVEVHPGLFVSMTDEEFRARYSYSRKNNTAAAVEECWEAGLDRVQTVAALGLSYRTVDRHFPKHNRPNPDLDGTTEEH